MLDSFVTPWTVAFRLLCPWDFLGKNTAVGCHFLHQGIFLTQGSNLCLLHWQADSLPLSHPESPLHWVKVLITLYNCRQCVQPLQFCFSLLNSLLSTFLHKPQNCHSSHCLLQLFPTMGPSRYFQVLAIIQLCLKQCDPNCTFFFLAFKFYFNFILYWSIAS